MNRYTHALLALLATIPLAGCTADAAPARQANAADPTTPPAHVVTIDVTTTRKGLVSWVSAGQAHSEVVVGRWTKDVGLAEGPQALMVKVHGDTASDPQKVTCELTVMGVQKDHGSAKGPGGIATCMVVLKN